VLPFPVATGESSRFRSLPIWRLVPITGALLGDIARYLLAAGQSTQNSFPSGSAITTWSGVPSWTASRITVAPAAVSRSTASVLGENSYKDAVPLIPQIARHLGATRSR
jgi:hypothetical protein